MGGSLAVEDSPTSMSVDKETEQLQNVETHWTFNIDTENVGLEKVFLFI